MRAGVYIKQTAGYAAFIPKALPPDPPIKMTDELLTALSDADRSLGRLDGVAEMLPDPDMFVAMYMRKEAVLSSQIEGTQASLTDLLEFEAKVAHEGMPPDVAEVFNYVRAMNYGLKKLEEIPLSLRLIREIHRELLKGVRGHEKEPGEFRHRQNWLGPPGCSLGEAVFIPPPPHEAMTAMSDLEMFLHDPAPLPLLIRCGLMHAQFETIHPFLDGNGRIGRLLVTFLLCHARVLSRPLLYISLYLRQHRAEYYSRLMAIREKGDWEGWLLFFLRGIHEVAHQATDTARRIVHLREAHQALLKVKSTVNALALLDLLYEYPVFPVRFVAERLKVSRATVYNLVKTLVSLGLLQEVSGRSRNRYFSYQPYLKLFG